METQSAFCPRCQRPVHLTWTTAPVHEGHAPLPDGPQLICLDLDEGCQCQDACPVSHLAPIVMEVRLARSGLREDWPTTRVKCRGCERVTEMQILDDVHLLCTECGTTNPWVLQDLLRDGPVVTE